MLWSTYLHFVCLTVCCFTVCWSEWDWKSIPKRHLFPTNSKKTSLDARALKHSLKLKCTTYNWILHFCFIFWAFANIIKAKLSLITFFNFNLRPSKLQMTLFQSQNKQWSLCTLFLFKIQLFKTIKRILAKSLSFT